MSCLIPQIHICPCSILNSSSHPINIRQRHLIHTLANDLLIKILSNTDLYCVWAQVRQMTLWGRPCTVVSGFEEWSNYHLAVPRPLRYILLYIINSFNFCGSTGQSASFLLHCHYNLQYEHNMEVEEYQVRKCKWLCVYVLNDFAAH